MLKKAPTIFFTEMEYFEFSGGRCCILFILSGNCFTGESVGVYSTVQDINALKGGPKYWHLYVKRNYFSVITNIVQDTVWTGESLIAHILRTVDRVAPLKQLPYLQGGKTMWNNKSYLTT